MDLDAKLATAKAKLEAAKAAITEEDQSEIAKREEIARTEEDAKDAENVARELDLSRRMDLARETLGDAARIDTVSWEDRPDTFIVQYSARAHADWKSGLHAFAQGKKVNREELDRKYAIASVYDWNGQTDWNALTTDASKANKRGVANTSGAELIAFLTANPGMVTPILDAVAKLAGVFASEKKRT